MRVLVIEDDEVVADLVSEVLERAGHVVDHVTTGEDALWLANEVPFDVIVLDLGIPAPDGMEVCRRLRATGNASPILMLTGRDAVEDRVLGLDAGADDYLAKPFAAAELQARIRSLARRVPSIVPPILEVGDLRLDTASRSASRGSTPVQLTATEFKLLDVLMRYAGQVLSRDQLLRHIRDFSYETSSNVIDVSMRRLRGKVDRPFGRHSLRTARGTGYWLDPSA